MALRKIALQGEECLEKVCRPVTDFNGRLHTLLDDLADTLEESGGVGLAAPQVGDIYTVPISHGEGRFLCSEELVRKLADNGQIVTQYVDEHGVPGMDVDVNPNGSIWAVEGIMSPDGRVLGKMGHSERVADGLYKNVDGCYDMKLFQSAKKYFDI